MILIKEMKRQRDMTLKREKRERKAPWELKNRLRKAGQIDRDQCRDV